jgi:2-dehydro-3-deoxygluconokinase
MPAQVNRSAERHHHDLVTLGEVLLRLSVPSPGRIETARQLDVQIGGAEGNVAAAGARLGLSTAWVSGLPRDPWGERVRRELAAHGVDCAYVRMLDDARLGVYFLEYGTPPRPIRVLYDRRDSAFARLRPEDLDWEPFRRARLVHLTGITPALGEGPRALFERALDEAACLSLDVNFRARLWSPDRARATLAPVLRRARYLFVGAEEARVVFGLTGPAEAVLAELARQAPGATISLLQGPDGSTVRDDGRTYRPTRQHQVQVVDPIGAGDAYVAGFLWAILQDRSVADAVEVAAAVAALKCSLWGDIAAISAADVEDALAGSTAVRR